jgi:predicted DNA-binding protein
MLGIRLDSKTERDLEALARRQGRTKSAVVREAIRRYLTSVDLAGEARRQSLAVGGDGAEQDAIRFIEQATDLGEGD